MPRIIRHVRVKRTPPNPPEPAEQPVCKICLEPNNQSDLIRPCNCTTPVHRVCLNAWHQADTNRKTVCEICQFEYQYKTRCTCPCEKDYFIHFFACLLLYVLVTFLQIDVLMSESYRPIVVITTVMCATYTILTTLFIEELSDGSMQDPESASPSRMLILNVNSFVEALCLVMALHLIGFIILALLMALEVLEVDKQLQQLSIVSFATGTIAVLATRCIWCTGRVIVALIKELMCVTEIRPVSLY
jgi:hypothetical protein